MVLEFRHDGNGTDATSVESEKEASETSEDRTPDVVWDFELKDGRVLDVEESSDFLEGA